MSINLLTAALCLAELWRIFLGGHTGQIGQPQTGHPNQAQPTLPDFGQPLESNHKSLSSPNPSTLLFRGGSLLPNPFASLSSVPLRGKLPDLASLQNKPSRRRTALPDLTEVNTLFILCRIMVALSSFPHGVEHVPTRIAAACMLLGQVLCHS